MYTYMIVSVTLALAVSASLVLLYLVRAHVRERQLVSDMAVIEEVAKTKLAFLAAMSQEVCVRECGRVEKERYITYI